MRIKILTLIGFLLFIIPVFALFVIASSSDCGLISLSQVIIRTRVVLGVLAIDAVIVTYLQKIAQKSRKLD